MTQKLLRRHDVEALTGLKRSSLYAKISEGDFPKPIKIGSRAVAWVESDVDSWIENKIKASCVV